MCTYLSFQEENWDEDGCFEPARIYRTADGGGKGHGPGLAMTRSLGDFDAASIGVIGAHRGLLERPNSRRQ